MDNKTLCSQPWVVFYRCELVSVTKYYEQGKYEIKYTIILSSKFKKSLKVVYYHQRTIQLLVNQILGAWNKKIEFFGQNKIEIDWHSLTWFDLAQWLKN